MANTVLGIETSGLTAGIALRADGEMLEECELDKAGRRHAQTLVFEIQQLLQRHSLKPADVDVCAVSQGPGSFTGLRVGIVFAKMLAWSTGCRLIPVDTFEAIAAASGSRTTDVSVVSDAQREQLFAADYQLDDSGNWLQRAPICIVDIDVWLGDESDRRASGRMATGPGLRRLEESQRETVSSTNSECWDPKASHVAAIGERLAAADGGVAPKALEPFYLRRSAAEEKRDLREQESAT